MNWKINATVISILMISISRLYDVSGENFKSTDESPNITSEILTNIKFGEWESWSSCSATCGESIQIRRKNCLNKDGTVLENCFREEKRNCQTANCPPVFSWGNWKPWSSCSATCGSSTKKRTRNCLNVDAIPYDECFGEEIKTENCSTNACPPSLVWRDWQQWSSCSATCGESTQRRRRICYKGDNTPHNNCFGEENRSCPQKPACPPPLKFGSWQIWSECSSTCGKSVRTRKMPCLTDNQSKMDNCFREEKEFCTTPDCPPALVWGDWMSWSFCSATCGPSMKRRIKRCFDDSNVSHIGCFKEEFQNCQTNLCPPENLKWANWASWSGCTAKCGFEKEFRRRQCLSKNGTLYEDCYGEESQTCTLPTCKPITDGNCDVYLPIVNSYLNEINQLKSDLIQKSSVTSALKAALLNKDYIKLLEVNPGLATQSSIESSSFPLHAFSGNCNENSAITKLEINPYWTIPLDKPHLISSIHVGVLEENAADFRNIFVVVSNKAGDTDTSRRCHHFVGPVVFNGSLVMNCGKLGSHVTIFQEGTARLRLCQLKIYEEFIQWTGWSEYSQCSIIVGKGGLKNRKRYCIRINGQSGDKCIDEQREVCKREGIDCSSCSEATPGTSNRKKKDQTLSAGEISGIVIGLLLVIGLIAGSFVLWLLCARRNAITTRIKQTREVNLKSHVGPTMTAYKPREWLSIARQDHQILDIKGRNYEKGGI